jgi:Domain of unknown function (DUF6458)
MSIGSSIFLIAVGAILKYAVTASVHGVNVHTVGMILMVVGVAGLVLSVLWLMVWADRTRGVDVVERRHIRDDPYA